MRTPLTVGVAGLGVSGCRLAQLFDDLPQAKLRWLCDPDPAKRLGMRPRFPNALVTADLDDLLEDDDLDAIVVAPPASHRARFVARALEADKHVLVDKTIALTSDEAERLVRAADSRGRCVFAANELLFHPAVRKLKELIEVGGLGELLYLYANRQGLGRIYEDASALWSLGPDEIGTVLFLLDDQPVEISAQGDSYVRDGIDDVVFCYLKFATGISVHLHLSRLDPNTAERLTVVGSERMAVFDDLAPELKLTVHEKSVAERRVDASAGILASAGDILAPRLPGGDPLRLECEHFISTIRSGKHLGAREAAAVVAVLEALQQSLDGDGIPVPVSGAPEPSIREAANVTPLRSGRASLPQAQ
jgi:predicted dehydrogenase